MRARSPVSRTLIAVFHWAAIWCVSSVDGAPPMSVATQAATTLETETVLPDALLSTAGLNQTEAPSTASPYTPDPSAKLYQLRLVGTSSSNEGVLQIYMNDRWGEVLGHKDSNISVIATVACREMGYSAQGKSSIQETIAHQYNAQWLMANVVCSGSEQRLVDCGHINYTSAIWNGDKHNHIIVKCLGETLQNSTVNAQIDENMWLSLSIEPYGPIGICAADYAPEVGDVICRELGHAHAISISVQSYYWTWPIRQHYLYAAQCTGLERALSECVLTVDHYRDTCVRNGIGVEVYCSDVPSPPLGAVVQIDYLNRVRVFWSGEWNYVSSLFPRSGDAFAVCSQLGERLNIDEAWVEELEAEEDEEDYSILPYIFSCDDGVHGSLMECLHELKTVTRGILHVRCSERLTPEYGMLRLVDGNTPNKGRVEIYVDYQWGTVCDDNWSDQDARVVCRQLGLGPIGFSRGNAYYGRGDGPIFLDDVQCEGSELDLLECSSRALRNHNCQHSEDAGVECKAEDPGGDTNQEWKVELVGSHDIHTGTIQVHINGQVGTVCDDLFDLNDGLVVCRMLGYRYVAAVFGSAMFGFGQGEILLDDLKCTGEETSLEQCVYGAVGRHNCGHHEDAGVACSNLPFDSGMYTETPLMLTNPNLPVDGLNMGIGSATILITLLVVMCVGCMFCACFMRRIRVNASAETINNNRDNNYTLVDQRDGPMGSANSVPPSYTDVLRHPNDYTQVQDSTDSALPPQSPPPTSPPPSYALAFQVGPNTMRVVTIRDPVQGADLVRREPIPIPLSPPPSYDDAAPEFPIPSENRLLPDVVTITQETDERTALREGGDGEENENETIT